MSAPLVTVVGIGQPFAGDDGAGPAVIAALRHARLPAGVDVLELPDPADLIPVLERGGEVIVVDAVVGGPVGALIELDPDQRDPAEPLAVSSHGVGVMQALALARAVAGDRPVAHTRVFGIGIARPFITMRRLTPAVAAAVNRAARVIARLLRDELSAGR